MVRVLQLHSNFVFLILFAIYFDLVSLSVRHTMLQIEHAAALLHCVLFALSQANKEGNVREIAWGFTAHCISAVVPANMFCSQMARVQHNCIVGVGVTVYSHM